MEFSCIKGQPVVLTDILSQVYIGDVKTINEKLGRIVLKDVVQLPERIPINGYRHFDRNEIVQIRSAEFEEINGLPLESVEKKVDPETPETPPQISPVSEQPAEVQEPPKHILVTEFGPQFDHAISTLRNSPKIGLIALDTSKGRRKRASVIAASTPTDVFIFDLLKLGDELFVQGLKEILQSPEIEKVVHDSRLLSDCLKQKHAVSLENVRDVEAEDIIIVHQDRKTIRKHRRTLEYLVKIYLGAEVRGLGCEKWDVRPLEDSLLNDLAENISHLIPLQEAVQQKYLKRLTDASHLYCTHVRDLDMFDHMLYSHERTLRKEISEIVAPTSEIRGDGRPRVS